jgi:hypothetical protein
MTRRDVFCTLENDGGAPLITTMRRLIDCFFG